jgi:hypothetical protein
LFPDELKQGVKDCKRTRKVDKKARQLSIVAERVKKQLALSKHVSTAHNYTVIPTAGTLVYIAFDLP